MRHTTSIGDRIIDVFSTDLEAPLALYSTALVFHLTVTLVAVALAKPVTLKFKAPVASNTFVPSLLNRSESDPLVTPSVAGPALKVAVTPLATAWMPLAFF